MRVLAVIVGLGNIGKQYDCTRHNVGFAVIDSLLEDCQKRVGYSIESYSIKHIRGILWNISSPEGCILICKPSTYMNSSGDCITALLSYYGLSPSHLCVVHDELDISLGSYRMKKGGGDAGHNGLRSISHQIKTQEYTRLRIGIGRPHIPGYSIIDWVLGKFSQEERDTLMTITPHLLKYIHAFIEGGFEKAQYEINGRK